MGNARSFKAELDKAVLATDKANSGFSKLGAAAGVAGVAIAAGIAVGVTKSVEAATKFQSSMELIQTQAGGSAKEVAKMSKALVAMAASVGTGPEELSKGLYHVESAGFRGAKALAILRLAAEGAAVGHSDLEQTTTALVAAERTHVKGLGDVSHAMGTLNAIVGAGNMHMDDLTSALGTGVLPAAKAFGASIQDVGGALATMTSNGIPAVNAASGLKMLMATIAAPTSKAAKEFASIGMTSMELATTMRSRGLGPALEELKAHLVGSGLTATQTAAVLTNAFGKRSSTALLTLINNMKDLKTATDQVRTGATSFGANWAETQKTSEFATARFHAAIGALEIQIGAALLPTVTRMTNWFTANLPTAIALTKRAITALTPAFNQVISVVKQVVAIVQQHWTQISGVIKAQVDQIKAAFNLLGDLVHGRWDKIWGDVVAILRSKWEQVVADVKLIGPILLSLLEGAGKLALKGLANGLKALPGILSTATTTAANGAKSLGEAIYNGIIGAIQGLPGALSNVISAGFNALKSLISSFHVGIKTKSVLDIPVPVGMSVSFGGGGGGGGDVTLAPVSFAGAGGAQTGGLSMPTAAAGKSFLAGNLPHVSGAAAAAGAGASWAAAPYSGAYNPAGGAGGGGGASKAHAAAAAALAKLKAHLQQVANLAAQTAQGMVAKMNNAFDQVGSFAMKAFDGTTAAGLKRLTDNAANAAKQIQDTLTSTTLTIQSNQQQLTPAEAALKALQDAHNQAGLTDASTQAAAGLTAAQATGDPAQIAAAQKAVDDAAYNQRVADLSITAATERAAADQTAATQIAAAQSAADAQTKLVNDKLAQDTLNYQSQRDALQSALAIQLKDFKANLDKHPDVWKKVHEKVMKLFSDDFGPDFTTAGVNIGNAYIKGLASAFAGVGPLADKAGTDLTGASKAKGAVKTAKLPHLAAGGVTMGPTIALIGEAGPEAVIPLSRMGSGGGHTFVFNGWVADKQQVVEAIRNELIRTGRNTAGGALGGFG